jgi:hypothetical protein
MVLGCFGVYSALFAAGYWIYGKYALASVLSAVAVVSGFFLMKMWKKLKMQN